VAALELTLSLVFLVPLMLSSLDYGYFFYVSAIAEDAARAGVRAAVKASNGATCAATGAAVKASGELAAVWTGAICNGGAAACTMDEPPLKLGGATPTPKYTTVLLECLTGGTYVNPTWRITVTVDFPPAVGFVGPWMPASPIPNRVRYVAKLVSN
jgi:hypothetical protein